MHFKADREPRIYAKEHKNVNIKRTDNLLYKVKYLENFCDTSDMKNSK